MDTTSNWGMLGHDWAVDILQGHIANGRTRHAYLITGPKGVGRRTLALRMTQGLNCPQPLEAGIPCRACHTCQRIERMQHPDLFVVQAEEDIGGTLRVDQVRALQRSLSLSAYEAPYRVALLLRFEEANPNAANALLKTLEEPPASVILMLTARSTESLLPTIVSRCEGVNLRPLSIEQTSQGLQALEELPPKEANFLAHISNGRPGFALQLFHDQDALKQRKRWLDDHQGLLASRRVERFHYGEKLAKDETSLREALQTWVSLWRDVMIKASGASAPITNIDKGDEIDRLVNHLTPFEAKEMLTQLDRTLHLLDRNVNARLATQVLMLNLPMIS